MKVLFYGTPEFALPTLEALLEHHQVVGVVTQPDRPAGRGQRVKASPVKRRAEAAGLPVLQPPRLRDAHWTDRLRELGAEVAVVAAFGQILPRAALDVPPRGSINVHASLLPRYRGAAPIAWALIRGEAETGVTTFLMDEGVDTGPILLQERVPIEPEETAEELAARLSRLGARLLLQTLEQLGALTPMPQRHELATLAPRLTKEDGILDWGEPAQALVNRIRGCTPWPGATAEGPRGKLRLWRAAALDEPSNAEPGTLVRSNSGALAIATGAGLLLPRTVQPENRRIIGWHDFLRGARLAPGARFTRPLGATS
jgi:methionyl-tRNA formyltransferase